MDATRINHIPPDLVVKFQRIDIAGVILWLVLPPHIVYPRELNDHQLKAGGRSKGFGGLNRRLKEKAAESRWFETTG